MMQDHPAIGFAARMAEPQAPILGQGGLNGVAFHISDVNRRRQQEEVTRRYTNTRWCVVATPLVFTPLLTTQGRARGPDVQLCFASRYAAALRIVSRQNQPFEFAAASVLSVGTTPLRCCQS